MDHSVVVRGVTWGFKLMLFALATGYLYALAVGESPEALMWIPALSFLLADLYSLVFTAELAAIARDKVRRRAWARALDLGMEPTEQRIRWRDRPGGYGNDHACPVGIRPPRLSRPRAYPSFTS